MKTLTIKSLLAGWICLSGFSYVAPVQADCSITQSKAKLEGAERDVLTMENERIKVDIVPELNGRISHYFLKGQKLSPLEWLDDCPYNYGGRWEGTAFTYTIDNKGPDKVAVTVSGGGKISVALLRGMGFDAANPLSLAVQRTMTIERNSTCVKVDVKISNTGDGVAPTFRYMVHSVWGDVAPMAAGRAFWFLPTSKGVEFFDDSRGNRDMGQSQGASAEFSRFTPGQRADKPRYEAGGWGAVMTSAGPAFIFYDPAKYNFMQYWFGGDAEWHFTFEPHTTPVDLKPGETVSCSFTLALDGKDVPFNTSTISYEIPSMVTIATPGEELLAATRATTVKSGSEQAKINIEITDPSGKSFLSQSLEGQVQEFQFTPLSTKIKVPADAVLGMYAWTATADGKQLAVGKFEVLSAEELQRRKIEQASAALRANYEAKISQLSAAVEELQKTNGRWYDGANLALSFADPLSWPQKSPEDPVQIGLLENATPVLGLWKNNEAAQLQKLAAAPNAHWPEDSEKLLAALGSARAGVRDAAPDADGKGLFALVVDPAQNRVEIDHLTAAGNVAHFGRFNEKPGESDDTLGNGARAVAVDAQGNVWVATNAWGGTSVFKINQDNSPYEEAVIGEKGAIKKFSPDGKLLGTVSVLDAPMDLFPATADGAPVILAAYRNVSAYHGAQVREGVMVINTATMKRSAEIKVPGGSVCVDQAGHIWTADVAGHLACFDIKGNKLQDVASSPAPAVLDAKLPAGSPLPVVIRPGADVDIWALSTLRRKLGMLDASGITGELDIPKEVGNLWHLSFSGAHPVAIGDRDLFSLPAK